MSAAPLWAGALPPPRPPLPRGTVRADVAVIGAGLAGLSAALHLLRRRPGAKVLVLEAGRIGGSASSRSTGMLGPGVGQRLEGQVARLGPSRAAALHRATIDAVHAARALLDGEGISCELAMGGQLVVARRAADRPRVARLAALHQALGLPGEALDDDALARRVRLRPAAGDGPAALLLPDAGTLHPGKLLAGLAAAVERRGGTIAEGARVLGIPDGRPVRLPLENGEVVADRVVLATAGHTASLGVLRGRVLPVHLQALATAPLPREAWDAIGLDRGEGVVDARRLFSYFRRTACGRLVFGGGAPRYALGAPRPRDEARALASLARALAATIPVPVAAERGWTGVIGYVLDALPAIERLPRNPAVVHAVGWCGHGIALSLAAGAWVTSLLEDGAAPEDLPWFRTAPPRVPTEALRWLSFQLAVRGMAALDRLAGA